MRLLRKATLLLAVSVLTAALGCTSSPSEPKGGGGTPVTPKPPVPQTTYNITVTANPPNITSGLTNSSTITVDVHRTDTGAAPPDGTEVTLTTTLGGFNQVGGGQTVTLQLVNGRAQAALFGGTEVGTATVRATFSGSTGAANVNIGAPAAFYVSSIQPNVGDPAGGQTVTIIGGGFAQPVRVTFNSAAATVRSVSSNQIVVTTPSAAAAGVPVGVGETKPVTVTVTNRVNQTDTATDSLDNGFTYASGGGGGGQPQIFAVSPSSGTNDGGTRVTITGTGFQAPLQVFFGTGATGSSFNGVEATVVSVSPTQIVAITPAARGFGLDLSNQLVNVMVKNVNGGFTAIGTQQFKYGARLVITAIQGPGSGPASGGTQLVILGQGFDEPTTVSFHFVNANVNLPQQVLSTTGTQVVIRTTPAPLPSTCPQGGLITVDSISVTNVDNGDSATADVGFNFQLPLPQITAISPGSGATGTTVTITGQNFPGNPSVVFGSSSNGSSATVQQVTANSIRVTVPNPPAGFNFNTTSCGNGGTQNVPTPIDIVVQDFATGCSSTFRSGFLLSPSDTSCQGQQPQTPPTASFTSAPVAGHTIQFSDTSSGTPTSWLWDFGDGGTSTQQNPSHTYAAAGNYSVKLTVTNAGGSSQSVKVIAVP